MRLASAVQADLPPAEETDPADAAPHHVVTGPAAEMTPATVEVPGVPAQLQAHLLLVRRG
jgi:hypothetical protein